MPEPFHIVVPGVPVGQPRTKATIRGEHAGVYTPTKTSTGKSNGVAEFKATIRMMAGVARTGPLLSGPLRVDLVFVFPRQKTKVWKAKPMPRYRKVTTPDVDNLSKGVFDALKGVLWVDDNQVCASSVDKWHCSADESPHVAITVMEIPETQE